MTATPSVCPWETRWFAPPSGACRSGPRKVRTSWKSILRSSCPFDSGGWLGEPGMISINEDAQDGPGDPGSPRETAPLTKTLGTTFYDELSDSLGKSADCSGGIDAQSTRYNRAIRNK
jgi:hypothetical protein